MEHDSWLREPSSTKHVVTNTPSKLSVKEWSTRHLSLDNKGSGTVGVEGKVPTRSRFLPKVLTFGQDRSVEIVLHESSKPSTTGRPRGVTVLIPGLGEPPLPGLGVATAYQGQDAASLRFSREGVIEEGFRLAKVSPRLIYDWRKLAGSTWGADDLDKVAKNIIDKSSDKRFINTLLKESSRVGLRRKAEVDSAINYLQNEYNRDIHLFGHSLGGITAVDVADGRPDDIKSLTLAVPSGFIKDDSIEKMIPRFLDAISDEAREFSKSPMETTKMMAEFAVYAASNVPLLVFEASNAATSRSSGAVQGLAIKMPVSFVMGADDPLFDAAIVREYAQEFPHAAFEIIEGAGHNLTYHQKDIVAAILANIAIEALNYRCSALDSLTRGRIHRINNNTTSDTVKITEEDVAQDLGRGVA